MADRRNEPVAVIGLGRFGVALALELVKHGTEVLAVDNDPQEAQRLSGQLPHVVAADATDLEALTQLGINEFGRAVVAIGADIEASILVTSMLAEIGVPDIWAKAQTAQHATILARVGAHHVVTPEHDMGERIAHLLSGHLLDYIEVDDNYAMAKTFPPHDVAGVPLRDSKVRSRYGVTVVGVKSHAPPPGQLSEFTHASGDTVLMSGDVILVVGKVAAVERFAAAD
ncbi:TrkA family potassium uptake protein [Pilimelia columellifera]|uniref:TrkA family potassium uptake protein n=1 Tax=Pilimelia columellifera subsp. columellifera TaxID=706583 RepID=A0ABP6AUG6_9ACTN